MGQGTTGVNHEIESRRAQRAFARAAVGYDPVAGLQQEMAERLLSRLDYIKLQPACILDVGCGTGWMTARLAQRYPGARVLALDYAPPMLVEARRRPGSLALLCARAEALPLVAGSVDLLVSNAVLQWCNDPSRVFAEWLRVMRPGGLLMFTSFGPGTLAELRQAWSVVDDLPHVSRFVDMHTLGDALLGGGWQGSVMDVDRFTLNYPDVTALMRDLKALGATNALLGRRRTLTGKGRLDALRLAYEPRRRPGLGLPASYEAVYGHAWAPLQQRQGEWTRIPLRGLDLFRGR
jgi:malonyl-CoA O-methyltransferase